MRLYQPIRVKGRDSTYYEFQRPSDERYGPIRALASRFKRPFSVLDIGANYGYFDVRLMEEFDCCCALVDDKRVLPVLETNGMLGRCAVMSYKLKAKALSSLARSEHFDIVLALSVLHHFDEPKTAYEAIRKLGWWSVFEVPGEDDIGAANPGTHGPIRALFGEPHGYFDSHVSDCRRPYFVLKNAPYLIEQSLDAADRDAPAYERYEIETDFERTVFRKGAEERDFVPGMNLYNFLRLGGTWPDAETIEREIGAYSDHPDFQPWNFVVGFGISPIDMVPKCGP